jgi:hypothetical protein
MLAAMTSGAPTRTSSRRDHAARPHAPSRSVIGATIGATALGAFGAGFSWRLERLPRLAFAAAATGIVSGAIAGAVLGHERPFGDSTSNVGQAGGGALVGAAGGAFALAGLAGIVLPVVSTVSRGAAAREFALHGAILGGGIGAALGVRG